MKFSKFIYNNIVYCIGFIIFFIFIIFINYKNYISQRPDFLNYIPQNTDIYLNINLKSLQNNNVLQKIVLEIIKNNFHTPLSFIKDKTDNVEKNEFTILDLQEIFGDYITIFSIQSFEKNKDLYVIVASQFNNLIKTEKFFKEINLLKSKDNSTIFLSSLNINNQFENNLLLNSQIQNSLKAFKNKDLYFYFSQNFVNKVSFFNGEQIVGGVHFRQDTKQIDFEFKKIANNKQNKKRETLLNNAFLPIKSNLAFFSPSDFYNSQLIENKILNNFAGLFNVFNDLKNKSSDIGFIFFDGKSKDETYFVIDFVLKLKENDTLISEVVQKIKLNLAKSFPIKIENTLKDGTQFTEMLIDPNIVEVFYSKNKISFNVKDNNYELVLFVNKDNLTLTNYNKIEELLNEKVSYTKVFNICGINNITQNNYSFLYSDINSNNIFLNENNFILQTIKQDLNNVVLLFGNNFIKGCLK